MKTRVAVASSDGKYVNQHFGRATQFLIFEMGHDQDREDNDNPMDPGDHCEYRFIELRRNEPSCPGEDLEENKHLHVSVYSRTARRYWSAGSVPAQWRSYRKTGSNRMLSRTISRML